MTISDFCGRVSDRFCTCPERLRGNRAARFVLTFCVLDLSLKLMLQISKSVSESSAETAVPPDDEDWAWFLTGASSLVSRHVMDREDEDPSSDTFGLWTPPPGLTAILTSDAAQARLCALYCLKKPLLSSFEA
eukprot:6202090-Pleurochrysis_carterae.AAC.1